MDGLFFTFLPTLFKLGVGVGLPLYALYRFIPVASRAWEKRLFTRRGVKELEQYSERANALVCRLLVEGVLTTSAREELCELQADYSNRNRKSLTH